MRKNSWLAASIIAAAVVMSINVLMPRILGIPLPPPPPPVPLTPPSGTDPVWIASSSELSGIFASSTPMVESTDEIQLLTRPKIIQTSSGSSIEAGNGDAFLLPTSFSVGKEISGNSPYGVYAGYELLDSAGGMHASYFCPSIGPYEEFGDTISTSSTRSFTKNGIAYEADLVIESPESASSSPVEAYTFAVSEEELKGYGSGASMTVDSSCEVYAESTTTAPLPAGIVSAVREIYNNWH